MAVTIGNARISEFGTVNGKRGDQTGKEVMTQSFASGGKWEYCIRPKSVTAAKKIATAMKQACANNNIGYSQTDRTSLSDADVVPAGLILPGLLHIQSAELAEAVGGEEDLFAAFIGDHDLRPVDHG